MPESQRPHGTELSRGLGGHGDILEHRPRPLECVLWAPATGGQARGRVLIKGSGLFLQKHGGGCVSSESALELSGFKPKQLNGLDVRPLECHLVPEEFEFGGWPVPMQGPGNSSLPLAPLSDPRRLTVYPAARWKTGTQRPRPGAGFHCPLCSPLACPLQGSCVREVRCWPAWVVSWHLHSARWRDPGAPLPPHPSLGLWPPPGPGFPHMEHVPPARELCSPTTYPPTQLPGSSQPRLPQEPSLVPSSSWWPHAS